MGRNSMAVRVVLSVFALMFLPVGVIVLKSAFAISEPHIFVMFIFSGSLSFLVGLVGLVGLIAALVQKKESNDEESLT